MQSRVVLLLLLGLAAVSSAPQSHPKNDSRSFETKDCYHYQCVNLVNHVLYTSCTDGVHSTGAVTVNGLYQLMPWASDCAGHGYGLIECGNKYYAWSPDLPPTWDCGCHPCLVHGCGCEGAVSEADPTDEVTPIHSNPIPPPAIDEDDIVGIELPEPEPAHPKPHHGKPGHSNKNKHHQKPVRDHKEPKPKHHPKKETEEQEEDKPSSKHHKKEHGKQHKKHHKKHHDDEEEQTQKPEKPHRRHPKRGDVPPIATDPIIEQPLPEPPTPEPTPEPAPVELACTCNEGSESCNTGCYINGSGDEEVIRSDAGTGRRCGNLSADEHFIITAVDGCSCQGHKLGAAFDAGCSWVYCHVLHRSTC